MKFKIVYSNYEEEFTTKKDNIVVGRGSNCDLRILEDGISRNHARIFKDQDKIFIEDLGSANGTSINDEKISKAEFTTFFPAKLCATIQINLLDEVEEIEKVTRSPKLNDLGKANALDILAAGGAGGSAKNKLTKSKPIKATGTSKSKDGNKSILQNLVIGLVLLGGGFYYYTTTQESDSVKSNQAQKNQSKIKKNNKNTSKSRKNKKAITSYNVLLGEKCNTELAQKFCRPFNSLLRTKPKLGFFTYDKAIFGIFEFEYVMDIVKDFKEPKDLAKYIYQKIPEEVIKEAVSKNNKYLRIDLVRVFDRDAEYFYRYILNLQKLKSIIGGGPSSSDDSSESSGMVFTSIEDFKKQVQQAEQKTEVAEEDKLPQNKKSESDELIMNMLKFTRVYAK